MIGLRGVADKRQLYACCGAFLVEITDKRQLIARCGAFLAEITDKRQLNGTL
ncbi:hypothetical protein [Paenibacillus guangzhouensis]|uniref:hypothetical protein n=1 Tax=Paenibacillus guangzhouensis TaxID=1473112 RepID=UPI00187B1437|nr:hypothetical protein [Paenibacillus guangzhouensis]